MKRLYLMVPKVMRRLLRPIILLVMGVAFFAQPSVGQAAPRDWAAWFLIHPEIKANPGATVTPLWSHNQTHLDLFMVGTDGAVWSTFWESEGSWRPWFLIHPEIKMQPGATVTALWRDQHLDLFVTGTDGAVWSSYHVDGQNGKLDTGTPRFKCINKFGKGHRQMSQLQSGFGVFITESEQGIVLLHIALKKIRTAITITSTSMTVTGRTMQRDVSPLIAD